MLKNIKVKLACVLIALGVWLFVVLRGNFDYVMDIPLKPVNVKSGRTIASEIPEKIKIRLNGRGNSLLSLWLFGANNINLALDLSSISSYYEFASPKLIDYIKMPRGFDDVKVEEIISPDSIAIYIDKLNKKTLKISSENIFTETADGYYKVGEYLIEPDTLVIEGPNRLIKNIRSIFTERKEYKSKKKDFSDDLKLIIPNPTLNKVNIDEVKFSAVIQKLSEKEFIGIPVKVNNAPPGSIIQITPKIINIKVLGGLNFLRDLSKDRISAEVNYNKLWKRNREYKVPLDITLPKECLEHKTSLTEVLIFIR